MKLLARWIRRLLIILCVLPLAGLAEPPQPELRARIVELNRQLESVAAADSVSGHVLALLQARKAAIEQLIRAEPGAVRALALPEAVAERLSASPATAALLERESELSGVLAAVVADDFERLESRTVWYLQDDDGTARELHFVAAMSPDTSRGERVTVRGIATDRVVAVEALSPALGQPDAVSAAAPVASAAPACSTIGDQRVAVIIVTQPSGPAYPSGFDALFWDQAYFGPFPRSTNSYWREGHFNATWANGAIFGPYALAADYTCDQYNEIFAAAVSAARAGGIDLSDFNRFSVIFPVTTCTYGGLGSIGCWGADANVSYSHSRTWIPIRPTSTPNPQLSGLLSHELGHNLTLPHAGSLDFGSLPLGAIDYTIEGGQPAGPNNARHNEYGDKFSSMGYATVEGHYASHHQADYLGWLTPSEHTVVTSSGTFTITPYENSGGRRALRVLRDPLHSSWLWLEFRQPIGFYDAAFPSLLGSTNIFQGAHIYLEDPNQNNRSQRLSLLHFNPTAAPNDFNQAAMLPGQSWADPYSPLRLTVNSASSAGLAVSVAYDAPCASISLSAGGFPHAGGSGTATITAPASCAWEASTASAWIAFVGPTSGAGNGNISFTVAANTGSYQRSSFITIGRQSVSVRQAGTGVQAGSGMLIWPLEPVLGTTEPVVIRVDDPKGAANVREVLLTFATTRRCSVLLYPAGTPALYLLDPAASAWLGPISAGSASSLSNAYCTLHGSGSSVELAGDRFTATFNLQFTQAFQGAYPVLLDVCGNLTACEYGVRIGTRVLNAALTGVTLTPSVASPQAPGANITWTAAASGGSGTPEYKFFRYINGAWTVVRDWSTTATWQWNTTGLASGSYYFTVYARNVGSTASYEASKFASFALVSPASSVTLTPSPASPQPSGVGITWTAAAAGGSGSYQYKFFRYVNGAWAVVRDWSTSATWQWNSSGSPAGTYYFTVYARNVGSTAGYEASKFASFLLSFGPATAVTLTPNVASPEPAGTPVTFTASASGGAGNYEYRFYKYVNGAWTIVQNYSSANTWQWNTTGAAQGTHHFTVYARNAGSSAPYDATKFASFTLTVPVTAVSLTPSPASPQPVGTTVTFTAAATGGSNVEYRFYRYVNGAWTVVQNYSTANTWQWNTSGAAPGAYYFTVYARNVGSSAPYEATKFASFTLGP